MILLGVISTLAGITGGIVKMLREYVGHGKSKGGPIPEISTDFIRALKELFEALVKAPIWLALVLIGFVLIAWGGTFIK